MVTVPDAPQGFAEAFPELFRMACRAAAPLVGAGQPAEDVASEALIRALVRWRSVQKKAGPWVIRVATNLAIDEVRRRGRQARDLDREPVEILDRVVPRLTLVPALAGLGPREREVVVLQHLAGYSVQEVADRLGLTTGAVKKYGHRAKERLRRALGEDRGSEGGDDGGG